MEPTASKVLAQDPAASACLVYTNSVIYTYADCRTTAGKIDGLAKNEH